MDKPMSVGELIRYLGAYDESRIVVVQDSATFYNPVFPIIIRDGQMRKSTAGGDQYVETEDGNYLALIIG